MTKRLCRNLENSPRSRLCVLSLRIYIWISIHGDTMPGSHFILIVPAHMILSRVYILMVPTQMSYRGYLSHCTYTYGSMAGIYPHCTYTYGLIAGTY